MNYNQKTTEDPKTVPTFQANALQEVFEGETCSSLATSEGQLHAQDKLEGVNFGSSASETRKLRIIESPRSAQNLQQSITLSQDVKLLEFCCDAAELGQLETGSSRHNNVAKSTLKLQLVLQQFQLCENQWFPRVFIAPRLQMNASCDNQQKIRLEGESIFGQPMLFECMGICSFTRRMNAK